MVADPLKYFRIEGRELLEQLGEAALELEKLDRDRALVQRMLRLAHTLKGAARVVKQPEIADAAHGIEEVLNPYRSGTDQVERSAVNSILALLDGIGTRLAGLTPAAPSEPDVQSQRVTELDSRTVRADVSEVDALLDGLAEIYAQLEALRGVTEKVKGARQQGELLVEYFNGRPRRDDNRLDTDRVVSIARDTLTVLGDLEPAMGRVLEKVDVELRQVRDVAEHLRLIPAGTLFAPLERIVRDTAQSLGRQVRFERRGGDVRIDAHVLDGVRTALVQIARNAVVHGIEAPAGRAASSKAPVGEVQVEIVRRGQRVIFSCRDDGQGIDTHAIRQKAAAQGTGIPADLDHGPEEVVRMLLRGGISTAKRVTELSGRGVGLDVVREAMERLGGEVNVRTERGSGTTVELSVPLSLTAFEALSVESAGTILAIPLDAVNCTQRVGANAIARTSDGESLSFDGQAVPLVRLSRALRFAQHGERTASGQMLPVVLLTAGGRLAAIGVDRIIGRGSVVLRPLPELAVADPIIAGASLNVEGNPQLVLDPERLIDAAARGSAPSSEAATARVAVLVIDDSLTTRMLEQSILESAGYEVETAMSAEEGLEKARARTFGLILVDVEMPGMDGFSFIEQIRADPALTDIPALLVTSRAAAEDRERGNRVGAQGYIVKSEFDQSDLLARIARLVS